MTTNEFSWGRDSCPKDCPPDTVYQKRVEIAHQCMCPGQQIDRETWNMLGCPGVMLVGNTKLNPDRFILRQPDYRDMDNLPFAGKSATLDFCDIQLQDMKISRDQWKVIVEKTFGKSPDRRDAIYVAALPNITEIGYCVFFAPTYQNGLHVRLVWGEHTTNRSPQVDKLSPVPTWAHVALTRIFQKAKIV